MKRFGKHFAQDWEDLPQELVQNHSPEEFEVPGEKAGSPLVLKVEGEEPAKTPAGLTDDEFIRQLHALVDERQSSDPADAPEEVPAPQAEIETAPLTAPAPEIAPEPAPEIEPEPAPEIGPEPEITPEPKPEPAPEPEPTRTLPPLHRAFANAPERVPDARQAQSAAFAVPATKDLDKPAPAPEPAPAPAAQRRLDDDELLAELYALMGETPKAQSHVQVPDREEIPEIAPQRRTEDPRVPTEEEEDEDEYADSKVPGWVKGVCLLLFSAAICGMTMYAVATDVLGKLF